MLRLHKAGAQDGQHVRVQLHKLGQRREHRPRELGQGKVQTTRSGAGEFGARLLPKDSNASQASSSSSAGVMAPITALRRRAQGLRPARSIVRTRSKGRPAQAVLDVALRLGMPMR